MILEEFIKEIKELGYTEIVRITDNCSQYFCGQFVSAPHQADKPWSRDFNTPYVVNLHTKSNKVWINYDYKGIDQELDMETKYDIIIRKILSEKWYDIQTYRNKKLNDILV